MYMCITCEHTSFISGCFLNGQNVFNGLLCNLMIVVIRRKKKRRNKSEDQAIEKKNSLMTWLNDFCIPISDMNSMILNCMSRFQFNFEIL